MQIRTTSHQMRHTIARAEAERTSIVGIIRKALDEYLAKFPGDLPAETDEPIAPVVMPDLSKKTVITGEIADDFDDELA
jgi:hypothetical protein